MNDYLMTTVRPPNDKWQKKQPPHTEGCFPVSRIWNPCYFSFCWTNNKQWM